MSNLSSLITTINCIIKYLLILSIQTSTKLIYKELKVNDFRHILNINTQVEIYKNKHLNIPLDHGHITRYKH